MKLCSLEHLIDSHYFYILHEKKTTTVAHISAAALPTGPSADIANEKNSYCFPYSPGAGGLDDMSTGPMPTVTACSIKSLCTMLGGGMGHWLGKPWSLKSLTRRCEILLCH